MNMTRSLFDAPSAVPPELQALLLLDHHYDAYAAVIEHAKAMGHPPPVDTRAWSQILISTLSGIPGPGGQKGADLVDGSDVKGASTWGAIDTPRFNGVIKAGTKAATSDRLESLDGMPHLYFVLWDQTVRRTERCRVWVVQPRTDPLFRQMCAQWYASRLSGEIKSDNFQLHPPRGLDSDYINNKCGSLQYPLYFAAERTQTQKYRITTYNPAARINGWCQL